MTATVTFLRVALVALGFACLVFSWLAVTQALRSLPARVHFDRIDLVPDRLEPIILGHEALMQPPSGTTASRHVAITRNDNGVFAYDITGDRRVGYRDLEGAFHVTGDLEIPQSRSGSGSETAPEVQLRIGETVLQVEVSENQIQLYSDSGTLILEADRSGARFWVGSQKTRTSLPGANGSDSQLPRQPLEEAQARTGWRDHLGAMVRGYAETYTLGGPLEEGISLQELAERGIVPINGLPRGSARLVYVSEALAVKPVSERRSARSAWRLRGGELPANIIVDGKVVDAEARPIQIVNAKGQRQVSQIIVGYTPYGITYQSTSGVLSLKALARAYWLPRDKIKSTGDFRATRSDPIEHVPGKNAIKSAVLIASFCLLFIGLAQIAKLARPEVAHLGLATAGAGLGFASGQQPVSAILFAVGVGLAALFGFNALFSRGGYPLRRIWSAALACTALGFAGFAVLYLQEGALVLDMHPADLGIVGAWLALSAPLLSRRMPLLGTTFWVLLVCLVSSATIASLWLAYVEPTQAWLRLAERHLTMVAGFGVAACFVLALAEARSLRGLNHVLLPGWPAWATRFLLFAGLVFILLTVAGNETGFGGFFQPAEMSKAILVVMFAATLSVDLARRTMLSAAEGGLSIWPPVVTFFLGAAILAASLYNYDMSPILVSGSALIFVFLTRLVLNLRHMSSRKAVRRWQGLPIPIKRNASVSRGSDRLRKGILVSIRPHVGHWPVFVLLLALFVLVGVGLALILNPKWDAGASFDVMDELRTPWKRMQSFYEMRFNNAESFVSFSETSDQLRRAREALLEAGCRLDAAGLCPTSARPLPHSGSVDRLLDVPAVQDDFAAVALVFSLGWDGALVYVAIQAMLITCMICIGIRCFQVQRDMQLAAWTLGVAVIGMAMVYAAQVTFAWGNALGFFPIMGQPLTFVSFGASHHLGVGVTLCVLVMTASILSETDGAEQSRVRLELFARRWRE